MKLYTLSYTQAQKVDGFILPDVLEAPDAEKYWYLAAIEKGEGCLGVAVINPRIDQPELLSIRVIPSRQREGVATELLDFGIGFLHKAGASTLRFIHSAAPEDWNGLNEWLSINGFVQSEPERNLYRITVAELGEQKMFSAKAATSFPKVIPISEVSERTLRNFKGEMLRTELTSTDLIDESDPDHSFVWIEDGHITAVFLLSPPAYGAVHNLWTWASPRSTSPKALQAVFLSAAKKAAEDHPPETVIFFPCLTPASERMVQYLLPAAQLSQVLKVYLCPVGSSEEPAEKEETENMSRKPIQDDTTSLFEERQADIQMEQVTNDTLCCADCVHLIEDDITGCAKYLRKPGAVLYGESCPMYEKR